MTLTPRGNKRTGSTSSPPAYSDVSHQPLTQSWNTISSWTLLNQLEIYQIKPHLDQIGTVNVSQRLWSLTAVVFGFWNNQARDWWESSGRCGACAPCPLNTPCWIYLSSWHEHNLYTYAFVRTYGFVCLCVCVCVCVLKDVWTRALFYTSSVEIGCNCCWVERDSGLQQGWSTVN